ncbi:MAG: hypothetical protein KBD10_01860 [Candidatus Pacebacteria bacterium]|jgi:hypothetical protein|nr:hypothetical protein [Candidatus Paceibacterota bacterium]
MILETVRGNGKVSVKVDDTLLAASDIAREAESLADDFFVVIQFENCDLATRKFLTPIILRAQMMWVLKNDGVIHVSIPGEGFYQYFLRYDWGDFYQEVNLDLNPSKRINERIDHIFSIMNGMGRKFSNFQLLEIPEEGRLDFSLIAIDDNSPKDQNLINWSWLF